MNEMRFILIFLIVFPLFSIPKTFVFVSNPQAKLCIDMDDAKTCKKLNLGQKLDFIKESGKFAEVQMDDSRGFVFRVFLSATPPDYKIPVFDSKELKQLNARARASSYVETASARGLSESQNGRIRGTKNEFDMESLHWLETVNSSN
jgi:hypothetical protein